MRGAFLDDRGNTNLSRPDFRAPPTNPPDSCNPGEPDTP